MTDTIRIGEYTYQRAAPRKESGGRWIERRHVSKRDLRRGRGLIRRELKTKEARAALALLVSYALELDRINDRREEDYYNLPGVRCRWMSDKDESGWMVTVRSPGGRSFGHSYGPFPSIAAALEVAAVVSRNLDI